MGCKQQTPGLGHQHATYPIFNMRLNAASQVGLTIRFFQYPNLTLRYSSNAANDTFPTIHGPSAENLYSTNWLGAKSSRVIAHSRVIGVALQRGVKRNDTEHRYTGPCVMRSRVRFCTHCTALGSFCRAAVSRARMHPGNMLARFSHPIAPIFSLKFPTSLFPSDVRR